MKIMNTSFTMVLKVVITIATKKQPLISVSIFCPESMACKQHTNNKKLSGFDLRLTFKEAG